MGGRRSKQYRLVFSFSSAVESEYQNIDDVDAKRDELLGSGGLDFIGMA